jgi:hypothetical protein
MSGVRCQVPRARFRVCRVSGARGQEARVRSSRPTATGEQSQEWRGSGPEEESNSRSRISERPLPRAAKYHRGGAYWKEVRSRFLEKAIREDSSGVYWEVACP